MIVTNTESSTSNFTYTIIKYYKMRSSFLIEDLINHKTYQ